MSDKKIGAGLAALYRETDTPDTYGDAMELYDPLPEIDLSSAEHDDTSTASTMSGTRAGITSVAALTFRVKTSEAGAADVIADRRTGTPRKWKYAVPSEGPDAVAGVESVILTAWVKSVKHAPSLTDETFITFTLNINDVEGES